MLGAVLLGWYLGQKVGSLEGFFAEYPYMRRSWWAAVLGDYGPVLVAPWAWLTLGTEEWFLGEDVGRGGKKDAWGEGLLSGERALISVGTALWDLCSRMLALGSRLASTC